MGQLYAPSLGVGPDSGNASSSTPPSRLFRTGPQRPQNYNRAGGHRVPVQRLQIGNVVALPEQGSEVEATVAREIDRTELTVRVTLRVEGREDFIKEWPIGEMVKVADGPFQNQSGIVEEIDPERGKLRVSVTIFGRATPVELEYWQVERG